MAVVPFDVERHLGGAVDVLLRVREADPTYPHPSESGSNAEDLTAWLLRDPALARWVALQDGEVRGYVQVTEPHAYLLDHLESVEYSPRAAKGFAEVAKLFVRPLQQRGGIGGRLLEVACAFAWSNGFQPGLAVVTTSSAARELYAREGMRPVGSFVGLHGINHVFVDETPGRGRRP